MIRVPPTPPPRHLLVVDDEPHIGLLLRPQLEASGYRVSLARSLAEGRAALATTPDAILLDLHLPDGSGVDFLRELRADTATRHLPVLILTGDDGDRLARDAKKLGAGLLTKPFSPSKLAAHLAALADDTYTRDWEDNS